MQRFIVHQWVNLAKKTIRGGQNPELKNLYDKGYKLGIYKWVDEFKGIDEIEVAEKEKEKPKEDLRYALLKYGLKIDNDKFVFKFNKDCNSGLLKSKMHVWEELYKPDKGAFGGGYKEEIEEKYFGL